MNHLLSFIQTLTNPRNMNAHLEENEKKLAIQRSADANEETGELDEYEASAEAEVETEHMLTRDIGKYTADSDGGDVSECMGGGEMSAVRYAEQDRRESGDGGHTPGEVWTESPHFLWGP
jgi:hypothetical protein